MNGKADLVNGKAHASYGGGGGGGGLGAGVAPWVTIDLPAHDSKLQTSVLNMYHLRYSVHQAGDCLHTPMDSCF